MKMFNKKTNEEERSSIEKLADSRLKVKHLHVHEKLAKQVFQYNASDLSQPLAKSVKDTMENYSKNLGLEHKHLMIRKKNFLSWDLLDLLDIQMNMNHLKL